MGGYSDVVGCFQWGAAVCVVRCSQGLGCHPHTWRLSPGIQSPSGVALAQPPQSGSSRAIGGGRMSLDMWPFGPGSKPICCSLSQTCASLWFIHIQMTYCSNGFVLHSNGLLTTWCCFFKCCALSVGVAFSVRRCVIAKAILGNTLGFFSSHSVLGSFVVLMTL